MRRRSSLVVRLSRGIRCTLIALPPVAALASCTASARDAAETRERRQQARPNIVVVLLDDLERAGLAYMPRTRALVGDSGMTLHNAFVSAPLCCPSRVSFLRGQYPHNTGITANGGRDGGFPAAFRTGVERSTVATWLRGAGYRTAYFGKYLNLYPASASRSYVPPGWSDWAVPVGGTPYREYDYDLNHNGRIRTFGHEAGDYGTDVYVALADSFVRRASAARTPFFLVLAPFAPHAPATPAPRHARLFDDVTLPETPGRAEEDLTDKHPMMRNLPVLSPEHHRAVEEGFRNRLRSLQAVDEGVERLIRTLREAGTLQSTVFVVTSDNGFHLLEHRLPPGKETAFEEDLRIPFVVRGPGIAAGSQSDAIVLNNDLAPSFAELAGIVPPDFVDGRSIIPLLRGQQAGLPRKAFLAERRLPDHLQRYDTAEVLERRLRARERQGGIREFADFNPVTAVASTPTGAAKPVYSRDARLALIMITRFPHFNALRTRSGWSYVEHDGGFVELYDLNRDPHQLENLAVTRPTPDVRLRMARYARWTQSLRSCRGASCRVAEDTRAP